MKNGYLIEKNFLSENELIELERILLRFHSSWLEDNQQTYRDYAINSAYLTDSKTKIANERIILFNIIGSSKLNKITEEVLGKDACFLNTQLFFNPYNKEKRNYWHRDIQYTGLSENEQKKVIEENGNNVLHFRIAIRDEIGVELIPGSNSRWDTEQEYNIRKELEGCQVFDDLPGSEKVSLERGDLLIFSANMLHRGLYSEDRLAFDIILCQADPETLKYAQADCLPNEDELKVLEEPGVFLRSQKFISKPSPTES